MAKKLSLRDKAIAKLEAQGNIKEEEPEKKEKSEKKKELKSKSKLETTKKPSLKNGSIPAKKKSLLTQAKTKKEEKAEFIKAKDLEETIIIGLIGPKGMGKTKRASDLEDRLKPKKKILYFDSEFKSDKIIRRWHNIENFEIINFTRVNKKNYKTESIETFQQFEKEFIDIWIPKLESGDYQYLVIDKGNVFMPFAVALWIKFHISAKRPNPRPQPFEYGEIYSILLNQIFYPVINCCRINGIHLILCFNTKGEYKNNKEVGLKENAHEALLDIMDYEFWLDYDYEIFCLKSPISPYWKFMDHNISFSDYFDNQEFIIDGKEINGRTREFKRYADFKEETLLTTPERIAKKFSLKKPKY